MVVGAGSTGERRSRRWSALGVDLWRDGIALLTDSSLSQLRSAVVEQIARRRKTRFCVSCRKVCTETRKSAVAQVASQSTTLPVPTHHPEPRIKSGTPIGPFWHMREHAPVAVEPAGVGKRLLV